jgi:hypothetical protein
MSIFGSRKEQSSPEASQGGGEPPFAGYERMSSSQLLKELPARSQVELNAADSYERANGERVAVLHKLRYLRGEEPLEGYDRLDNAGAIAAIASIKMDELKRVRGYERKFKRRPDVLAEIASRQQAIRAKQPAEKAPAYQSLGGASVKSPGP